ncbi:hypothetical protein H5410_063541 [Solanum commersonii]|uniref:HAT C-terminal dimerisation domain-containing protein n=1 Tax=Solanum commersonii TaxID=4109 RepID=A0A9J5WEM2_SOLCO|nr:hypothetical protein H5410_063541 [Solanum commersonii]
MVSADVLGRRMLGVGGSGGGGGGGGGGVSIGIGIGGSIEHVGSIGIGIGGGLLGGVGEGIGDDLSYQLDTFIIHMRSGNPKFSNLQGIRDLAKALVEANLAETYSLVYLLVKWTLILPVATATVERAFSSIKHIKNEVRNSIGNQYLNDCLVCYIERDVFINVSNDVIIDRFQNMKTRRGQL